MAFWPYNYRVVPFLFFSFLFIPMTNSQEVIMGIWKFSDKIPMKDLIETAQNWAKEDEKYLQLYIRKVSKDQSGIGFTYDIKGQDGKEAHDKYFNQTSDTLKRNYGNDLVGWDIASSAYIIK